jgi:flavin-dependent dehydrogenase
MTTDCDVLIIGAGPAGAVAASVLNRAKLNVLIAEKSNFPRFVIGESLLPRIMNLLRDADLLEAVTRQNFMKKTGAVFMRGSDACEFTFSDQSGDGWTYTYQVPRAEFDKALADEVQSRGVDIRFNTGVSAVKFLDTHAEVTLQNGDGAPKKITAQFVLDCSGYGRVLSRLLDLEVPSNLPNRHSLFTHVTGDQRPPGDAAGKIWICIHPQDAWIWIIPFSNGHTSVGVVADPEFYEKFPGDPQQRLHAILMSDPNAAPRLRDVKYLWPPKKIEGYSCAIKQVFGPRFAMAGNATEFLDPVFSSGVTLAVESGLRAAQVLARQLRGEKPDWQTEYADHLARGIDTFRTYVNRWYDGTLPEIFFAPDRDRDVMRNICSVLAGYVWDDNNPYAKHAERALSLISSVVRERQP